MDDSIATPVSCTATMSGGAGSVSLQSCSCGQALQLRVTSDHIFRARGASLTVTVRRPARCSKPN
eukprot:5532436-Amphidinium_carterae.1